MRTVSSASAMQSLALGWRRQNARVALVPTMGCLHDGHLSLVRRARRLAGPRGRVVVSIYVNPTQFGPAEDFARYPRDLKRDFALCRRAGVDAVFAPADDEMYPGKAQGRYSTYIVEERLSQPMEGAARPGHFRGVTTVVAKLFNLVLPDVAVFGAKDWQQASVLKRMARDLNFPVKIIVAPTLREPDGLAMSSRNKYLGAERRRQATVLCRALARAREIVQTRALIGIPPISSKKLAAEVSRVVSAESLARLDYVEFFEPDTLLPVSPVRPGTRMALAVFIGRTRLIDNAGL